jgi:hypothetical protein
VHADALATTPLVPERSDFLEGDGPDADKVQAFLAQALAATGADAPTTAGALVPWICDALLSNHSAKAYGRDLMDFVRHMQAQGGPSPPRDGRPCEDLQASPAQGRPHVGDPGPAVSVLRGTYRLPAAKGLISWETAQDIGAVKAPEVRKNSTPSLTQRQAIILL